MQTSGGGGGGATANLLDEALWGATDSPRSSATARGFVLVEDCAETSGGFVLHHLLKGSLTRGAVVLLALAHPFSHYDRVLRKLGCNLIAQRDSGRLHFIDMLRLDFNDSNDGVGSVAESGPAQLFEKIQKAAAAAAACTVGTTKIIVDDISLLEIAAHGSTDLVLDILHYCITLASEMDCSIVAMNHNDIYSDLDNPSLLSNLEYLADVIIRAQPLVTGLAADVHGQLTVINKKTKNGLTNLKNRVHNFHFKVKENGVDFFYPGKYC